MTNTNFDFPSIKRGDSFFPAINDATGGCTFLVSDIPNPETLVVTIEFKDERGYTAFKHDNAAIGGISSLGLTTEGKGAYRIETFIWDKPAKTYRFDMEFKTTNGAVISTATGTQRIIQDIANS